jgi:hypothetical protein
LKERVRGSERVEREGTKESGRLALRNACCEEGQSMIRTNKKEQMQYGRMLE